MKNAPDPQSPKPRIDWMDALRGLAITLVIFEHSVHNTLERGETVPWGLDLATDVFNPIRMPLMVFLSGLLLHRSIEKGTAVYLAGKLRNILYPFVIWSAVYIGIWIAVEPITGTPHSWAELPWMFIDPPAHLWFLRDLFLFYVLMLALRRVPVPVLLAVAFVVSAAFAVMTSNANNDNQGQRFFFLFAFFVLGDWTARHPGILESLLADKLTRIASILLTVGLVPLAWLLGNTRYELSSLPFAMAGLLSMLLLARALCRTSVSEPARFLGRNSLTIYIVHWLVVTAASVLLTRFSGLSGAALVGMVLACGLGGSALAIFVVRQLQLGWLFAFPKPATVRAQQA